MESSKIMMFPEMGTTNGIDPNLLLAMNNNGGFGNGGWIWILFLWLIWGCNGNGWGNNNGTEFLSSQMSNNSGRELLMNAIQGNKDAINSLSNMLNTDLASILSGINTISTAINSVGSQVGMSGLQIQNAIQSGNASLASQICQCCCENRLAIANQTNTLQAQMASMQAADQLAMCQQTSSLSTQSERNTRDITEAITAQSVMINQRFCDLEKRELQNKIDSLTADNALLRSNLNNMEQTVYLNEKFTDIQNQLTNIKASQPNTIPVLWPNILAVNTTPSIYGYNTLFGYNNSGTTSFWN